MRISKKRKAELLSDLQKQMQNTCLDKQVVERIGPKGGRTVRLVERFTCLKEKGHEGDHLDRNKYVGWSQGTVSPSQVIWGSNGRSV